MCQHGRAISIRIQPARLTLSKVCRTFFVCLRIWNPQLGAIIKSKDIIGETMLSKAVESGNVELFEAVRNFAEEVLTPDEV